MGYRVKLDVFEGPFDLMVYLIEHAQMSIYDIRISEITDQYMEYVGSMQEADVNVYSEFMVLAAALLEIKSKMLLPRSVPENDSGEVPEDRAGGKARGVQKIQDDIGNAGEKMGKCIFAPGKTAGRPCGIYRRA